MIGTSHPASLRSANKSPRPRLAQPFLGQAEGQRRGRLRRLPLHLKGALPSACPLELRRLLPDVCNPLPPVVMSDAVMSALVSVLHVSCGHVKFRHMFRHMFRHVLHHFATADASTDALQLAGEQTPSCCLDIAFDICCCLRCFVVGLMLPAMKGRQKRPTRTSKETYKSVNRKLQESYPAVKACIVAL